MDYDQRWSRVLNLRVRVPQKTSSTSTDIEKCTEVQVPLKSSSTSTFTNLAKEQLSSCNSSKFVAKT